MPCSSRRAPGPRSSGRAPAPGTPTSCSVALRGPYKRVEPLLVSLVESSEVFPLFQHAGIEILYMLEGTMEYSYGREHYRMERGDTLQFEGTFPMAPPSWSSSPSAFSPSPFTAVNVPDGAPINKMDTRLILPAKSPVGSLIGGHRFPRKQGNGHRP
jgi:hypothetical protein